MPPKWKPMPGAPSYEINPLGWVRNAASGVILTKTAGRVLYVLGRPTYLSRARLVALAKEAHAPNAPHELLLDFFPAGLTFPALPPGVAPPVQGPAAQNPKSIMKPKRKPSAETRHEGRYNPTRILPLRDPWATGAIEQRSPWDWAGLM